MDFKSAEWDNDETGDQLHLKLFQKKKKISKNHLRRSKNNTVSQSVIKKDKIKKSPRKITQTIKYTNVNKEDQSTLKNENKKKNSTKPVEAIQPCQTPTVVPKVSRKVKRLENQKLLSKKVSGLNINNLKKQLATSLESGSSSLRERMMEKLSAARFRYLNEQMYTSGGAQAQQLFQSDPQAFSAYHQGYRQQVSRWPLNPLDTIITQITKMPKELVVADFGCGDARLSRSVPHHVHSFDLVSANERVVACDMAHVPLKSSSVDVAVFCLSLMGTNLRDYLLEANRVLRKDGTLKIAEVESRFEQDGLEAFIHALSRFGFVNTHHDLSHNLFYFLDFVKERDVKHKSKLPQLALRPCLYKKR